MRSKLLIVISLMVSIGLTFGRNLHNQTNGSKESEHKIHEQKTDKKSTKASFDPMDEWLGLVLGNNKEDSLSSHFFDEHKKAMETVDKVFAEHHKQMESMGKEFLDFERNFFNFKNQPIAAKQETGGQKASTGAYGQQIQESKWTLSDPVTWFNNGKDKSNWQLPKDSISRSGLPVFHPIDQNAPNGEKLSSNASESNWGLDWDWEQYNSTNANQTQVIEDMMKPFVPIQAMVDTVFDSFAKFGQLLATGLAEDDKHKQLTNDTDIDNKMLITEQTSDGWVQLKLVDCKCPEKKYGKHKEDCPMNAQHMSKSSEKLPKISGAVKEESEKENRFEIINDLNNEDDIDIYRPNTQRLIEKTPDYTPLVFEHSITFKEDEYDWYDWALIATIAATSLVLLSLALIIYLNRTKRSKSVKLNSNVEIGVESPNELNAKELYKTNESGYQNENFNNKKMEKIKAIIVNMKN